MTTTKHLLCCDWGTSSFRLRLIDTADYKIIAEIHSAEGVGSTFKSWKEAGEPDRFNYYSAKLQSAITELQKSSPVLISNLPVILSGMASSSIGMQEIPYADLPFAADGSQASVKVFKDFNGAGSSLFVVSGVRSQDDVMRGEEAQLIGLFYLNETSEVTQGDSLFVFPGTHSKHIEVKDKAIIGFDTFMTGEIYNIISEHSILKDSIAAGADIHQAEHAAAFKEGVKNSATASLLTTLFKVRTNQLFAKFTKEQNALYLSGLLIGNELRELSQTKKSLVICSGKHLYAHYQLASEALNLSENIIFIEPELIDKATIAGQVQLYRALTKIYE